MARISNSTRGFASVGRYIQGPGEIHKLQTYFEEYGKRGYVLIDEAVYDEIKKILEAEASETELVYDKFSGFVTEKLMADGVEKAAGSAFVVGIGGGKTVDAAKGIACDLKVPVILVPTIASTDAPAANLTAIFNDSGMQTGIRFYKTCPDMVIVDSEIIAKAPARYFSAGIGDALATCYEAKASALNDNPNLVGSGMRSTLAGIAICEACEKTVWEKAIPALKAVEKNLVTPDLEDIIEANTLLSGLGFLNVGLGGAHATNTGFTQLPQTIEMLHGELVAFGIMVEFVVEQKPYEELQKLIAFLDELHLPITVKDLGVDELTDEMMDIVTTKACAGFWTRSPRVVDKKMIADAILMADACGKEYREKKGGK